MFQPPVILSIAGSDSGAGAGIQADLKTIMATGGYGICAVTAVTAQNGQTVAGIKEISPQFVLLQLQTILAGFNPAAAKTGMLFSREIIESIAPVLQARDYPLVVDPVCVSQSGCRLLQEDAITALAEKILPGCDLATPNVPEAELLTGLKITDSESAFAAAELLAKKYGAKAVLVKGGHLPSFMVNNDFLFRPGQEPLILPQPHVDTENNHGTGCTLSAAIACFLGQGLPLEVAVKKAQTYLNKALLKSYNPGLGHGPVNHAANLQGNN